MQRITSLDDPRVAPYRNLRERTLRGERLFLAEAALVVNRLLDSEYPVESIFVTEDRADEFAARAGGTIPVYVADRSLMVEIVGFPFHRGAMAVGCRRDEPSLEELMARLGDRPELTLVICPEATQAENLGMVFRTAAAMGIDALILGPKACDPLCRRALRVSMGGVLRVPYVRSAELVTDLKELGLRWDVRLVATILDDDAERLPDFAWPRRAGLMVGNEFDGLKKEWLALCEHRVTIPMMPGTDSLNLGVAAGICIYERMRSRLGSG